MGESMFKGKYTSPIPAPKIRWSDSPRAIPQTEEIYKFEEGEETLESFLGQVDENNEPEDASFLLSDFSQLPFSQNRTQSQKSLTPKRPVYERNRIVNFDEQQAQTSTENLSHFHSAVPKPTFPVQTGTQMHWNRGTQFVPPKKSLQVQKGTQMSLARGTQSVKPIKSYVQQYEVLTFHPRPASVFTQRY